MKVKLSFTLVGKSNIWKRNIPKGVQLESSNADTLAFVRDTVVDQFGGRALVIVNEHRLVNDAYPYPEYYAAGWFISEGDEQYELVVVDHGDTMEAATKAMMNSVKVVDWNNFSMRI